MQVIVAAPLDGPRTRLADALRAVALPGIAVVAAEPAGAGTGQLGAVALFQWGPVLLDVADWPALESQAGALDAALRSGGLQVLPPCIVRVLEPGDLPSASLDAASTPPQDEPLSAAYGTAPVRAAHRAAALSPDHLREVIVDLARERYGMQRWSTADVLWALDRLRLPAQAIEAISDDSLAALGFIPSRVPLLDGTNRPVPPAPPVSPAPFAPPAPPAGAATAGAATAVPPAGETPLTPAPFPARELVVPPEAPTTLIGIVSDPVAPDPVPPAVPPAPAAPPAPDPVAPAAPPAPDPVAPAAPPTAGQPAAAPHEPVPPTARLSGYSVLDDREDDEPPARRFALWPIAAAVAALVVIVCVVLFLNMGGGDGGSSASDGGSDGAATSAGPTSGTSGAAPPAPPPLATPPGYAAVAADTQTDCGAHSYGQVQGFFQGSPCTMVQRQLLTATTGGHPTVYAVREVTMPTPAAAAAFKALVDSSGTGNVNDLLREGARYTGGPTSLPSDTAYASAVDGARVRVVEAAPTDGTPVGDVAAVQRATDALAAAF